MQYEVIKKIVLIIIGCAFLVPCDLAANVKQEWNEKVMEIYTDDQLNDSLKIIGIANLTFDYCVYFRIMDEEVLQQYLSLLLPLVRKHNSSDLKVYLYRPVLHLSSDSESWAVLQEKYEGFIRESTDPLVRFKGWMIMAKANIDENVALNYLFNALNEVKDARFKKEQAEANQYISFYYSLQGNHSSQLKYALTSLELARQSGDVHQLVASLKDLGAAYYEDPSQGFNDEALEAYNEARKLLEETIKVGEMNVRSFDNLLYMEVLVTLGSIYRTTKQEIPAIKYLDAALYIASQNGFIETEAFCHKELGILRQSQKSYQKAETHYLTAKRLMEGYAFNTVESNHIEYEIQLQLASLYQETGHYKAAVTYYRAGIENYRRMFDEEMMNENQRVSAYYEARKQEEDIASLKAIVELKEKQKYYYWGIATALFIILLMVFRLYYIKIKTVRQRDEQLKNEAAMLELDRSRAELDARLKQEEAEQLQQKLLVGDELLEHKNRILDNLKQFIAGHSELTQYKREISNILMQQNRIESNMDGIKTELKDVPIDFYVRLQKHAGNKLTPLDLKYCRLIYLDTPSKEMAGLLFVDPKTIRVNKYRLKQKLNLGREDDLYAFISNIIPNPKD